MTNGIYIYIFCLVKKKKERKEKKRRGKKDRKKGALYTIANSW
jgi:hypothetical protein